MDRITALYQKLDPLQPLPAEDTQLYVDWQRELYGRDDIKLQLARGFARSSAGVPVTRLFTGHRGTGKTTELNRVKQMLEQPHADGAGGRKIFVSFLECEKWVDLNNLEPPDLILQMVRQLVLDLKAGRVRKRVDESPQVLWRNRRGAQLRRGVGRPQA